MSLHRLTIRLVAALFFVVAPATAQEPAPLQFAVTYDAAITDSFSGRVYVMLGSSRIEPRFGPSWFNTQPFFAQDVEHWKPNTPLVFTDAALSYPGPINELDKQDYAIQAVMRLNLDSPSIGRGPGTAYSKVIVQELDGASTGEVRLFIDQVVQPSSQADVDTDTLKFIRFQSELLSAFYGRDMFMEAAVALPQGYHDNPSRRYPALYVIPGFGGNHRSALAWGRRLVRSDVDGIVTIGLNPRCLTGHHVFADSANNGPRGQALIEELIPYLEQEFRLVAQPTGRFLTGASSGGWSSLWLQVTYADVFGGVWSIVPDPVDFRDFQRINLYQTGENMYVDETGNRRAIARRGDEPMLWYDDFAKMEVVQGPGGQLYSFEAVFSPRGPDGKPMPLYDRETGAVNGDVAQAWKKYDIGLVLKENWPTLESKLTAKLRIFAGEKDTFYLEGAVRLLKQTLDELGSDAVVEILEGRNHGNVADRALGQRIHQELRAVFDTHHPQYATSTPQDAAP
ncbi:MAG: enterochelin esterase [Planctomycetes bacterium]|nr:enterochelin esterase [Planctomycetota bacterium]